ncbi:FG-GAP repeat domain-containing protein [Wenxinia saemankumensis]|uniref:Repeat domain-containing protein n=1 Tax=Wenxinia saemankumensis TaxID=1447782 RepID=A0A1M6ESL3_9RHOB|nr:VCBS repeat-containing protein [Wenxinia saemankumensis]SHI88393.1 Repeat domain-containing protein [Wenxinia saemankumensis]
MRRAAALLAALVAPGAAAACIADQAALTSYPASVVADSATGGAVRRAWFDDPATRYDHGILGRADEPGTLWVDTPGNRGPCGTALVLGADHVFEDVAPRLADLDGDGTNEVVVVRASLTEGAQIAVYAHDGRDLRLLGATPHIGQPHRWLAPVGIADLDGDGAVEIAAVDRPHLARILRIWRWTGAGLVEVASAAGVTNHRIGDPAIAGGIRACGSGPEMIVARGDWSRLLALRFDGDEVTGRDLGPWSEAAVAAAMACR